MAVNEFIELANFFEGKVIADRSVVVAATGFFVSLIGPFDDGLQRFSFPLAIRKV